MKKSTGESVYIKPQSGIDEPYERNNWDSPILVSHHNPKRLYFGSQRVWKSNNRGDSWEPISKDLTKNEERLTLPIMGKQQSWDEVWDVYAMSTYNTITSLSESKLDENIIFAGTDDGIIQRTNDGGKTWIKTEVGSLPNVPSTAFVNDIKTDLHDKNKVYVALDNHKFGDYKPYLLKSNDGGKSWNSITNGIPNNSFVWRIVQDHINPNLLFLATEYGIYVSLNQGDNWMKFSQGLPTISFRDLAIQKRENDLVAASFGRSFYVLDDYTPLRSINPSTINKAQLFKPRKALQYQPISGGTSSQGASFFTAENPDHGALFTYYIPENFDSLKSKRQKKEKLLNKENKNIPFPGWQALSDEKHQDKPNVTLVIRNDKGEFITRIHSEYKRGINRVSWNLKQPLVSNFNMETINIDKPSRYMYSKPGIYNVTLYSIIEGETIKLGETQDFNVDRIRENVLKNPMSDLEISDYSNNLIEFKVSVNTITSDFKKASKKLKAFDKTLKYANVAPGKLEREIHDLKKVMYNLDEKLNGNSAKKEIREKEILSIASRISIAQRGFYKSTYGPTEMHLENFEIAKQLFSRLKPKLESFSTVDVPRVENLLKEAGVPILLD